jgi:hypothetical protein
MSIERPRREHQSRLFSASEGGDPPHKEPPGGRAQSLGEDPERSRDEAFGVSFFNGIEVSDSERVATSLVYRLAVNALLAEHEEFVDQDVTTEGVMDGVALTYQSSFGGEATLEASRLTNKRGETSELLIVKFPSSTESSAFPVRHAYFLEEGLVCRNDTPSERLLRGIPTEGAVSDEERKRLLAERGREGFGNRQLEERFGINNFPVGDLEMSFLLDIMSVANIRSVSFPELYTIHAQRLMGDPSEPWETEAAGEEFARYVNRYVRGYESVLPQERKVLGETRKIDTLLRDETGAIMQIRVGEVRTRDGIVPFARIQYERSVTGEDAGLFADATSAQRVITLTYILEDGALINKRQEQLVNNDTGDILDLDETIVLSDRLEARRLRNFFVNATFS